MKLSEQKHLALIEAAQKEFIEHGFHLANMDRVCEQASVSKRTLYKHFTNKEMLLSVAVKSLVEVSPPVLNFTYCPEKTISEQLSYYLNQRVALIYQQISLATVRMIVAEFIQKPHLTTQYLSLVEGPDTALKNWLEVAMDEGQIVTADSGNLVKVIMNLFNGYFLWPQLIANIEQPDDETQEQLINEIIKIFTCSYST
ncbi:TetR family transcriptional regulator [Vibrio qinghaiensis]|uniref:TetR family transcriptional regulator n=1 Tax=Vibrio qinghaiensis TaxID=2025808 RepID=A0A223N0R6_9VIBR|nr:TetR/AcrR family transcriptional regulator [Vibrio qinghaiensis]ASU23425.1 TetR family transcriptional regulator [Vibrio qinghaiensis]